MKALMLLMIPLTTGCAFGIDRPDDVRTDPSGRVAATPIVVDAGVDHHSNTMAPATNLPKPDSGVNCIPQTYDEVCRDFSCGAVSDNCGTTIDCGNCQDGLVCSDQDECVPAPSSQDAGCNWTCNHHCNTANGMNNYYACQSQEELCAANYYLECTSDRLGSCEAIVYSDLFACYANCVDVGTDPNCRQACDTNASEGFGTCSDTDAAYP